MKSDNLATVWYLQALAQGRGDSDSTWLVNYPFGVSLQRGSIDFLTSRTAAWLTRAAGPVFAFNFLVLLSFLLSGLFMYALVRMLAGNPLAGVISGLAYMVLPYHLAMSQYHFTLTRVEVFPVLLIACLLFLRRPRWYTVAGILLALLFCFSADPHYGLFGFVMLAAFACVNTFYDRRSGWVKPTVSRLAVSLTLIVLGALTGLPRLLAGSNGGGEVSLGKPFEQLYAYSSRSWEYLIPPAQHPVLGRLTAGFLASRSHGSYVHEQTLYLGWTVIVLAALGSWRLLRSRSPERRFLGVVLPLTAACGFICSLPPTVRIGTLEVPLPGLLLHRLFPDLRVCSRFGVIVATALVVLAGCGAASLLKRCRWKGIASAAVLSLVLFEFCAVPPAPFVDVRQVPAVYEWLRVQDDVVAVAEYPLGFAPEKSGDRLNLWDAYEYMFWQSAHGKPLFNGEPQSALDLAMKLQLSDPSDPRTPPRLRWLGVTHMVVHKGKLGGELLAAVMENEKLEVVYSDESTSVYELFPGDVRLEAGAFRYLHDLDVAPPGSTSESVILQPCKEAGGSAVLLALGPYVALPKGCYEVQFLIAPEEADEAQVRVVVSASGSRTVLAESTVLVSRAAPPMLAFSTEGVPDAECRVYACAGSLRFAGVTISKVSR